MALARLSTCLQRLFSFPPWTFGILALALIAGAGCGSRDPIGDATHGGTEGAEACRLRPVALRCESLENPLGIGETSPTLSWVLESDRRGDRQTAYRVLVAASEEKLKLDQGDLWDSGVVSSEETIHIPYGGKPLESGQECFWKVRVWDSGGNPSAWSVRRFWSMGLLRPADWKAEWIGHDAHRRSEVQDVPFDGASWIWFSADSGPGFPAGARFFSKALDIPADLKIVRATLMAAADDRSELFLNGGRMGVTEMWERVVIRDLTARLRPGTNVFRSRVENSVQSSAGLILKLTIEAEGGEILTLVTDGSWRSTNDPGDADWKDPQAPADSWPAARILGEYGVQPWGKLKGAQYHLPPASYLRTTFKVAGPIRRATLYASALGCFDVHLSGKRVKESRFDPGWTDYAKRVYYRTYDVTAFLHAGENAFGAVLADGWYSGYLGWYQKREHYGRLPRFKAQIELEYEDGSRETVATSGSWKASTGPILEADFLMGEAHDARKEIPGWDRPGFDDGTWARADTGAEVQPMLQPHPGPPVVAVKEFRPVSVSEPRPGAWVLDMGQYFAGIVRLKVSGTPGQKVTLRFAERLNPDGTLYTVNLRTARATDTYVCGGQGPETWEPRFTFHGFQYVEVSGIKGPPALDDVTGIALSSDTRDAGAFECSDPMLNRLRENIYWTQRANFIDIPTDCPQRDERLGWTGDAQVYVRTATLISDVHAFFKKWLVDLDDAQRADGQFPKVAPVKVTDDDGGPAWADAGVICPWTIWEVYGDPRVLERHYPAMKRFIEFCRGRSTPDLLPPPKYHCYGDWLSIDADTPKDVIAAAYFARSASLAAMAASLAGKWVDGMKYQELFEGIKKAFNKAYVAPDGRIQGDTQTCYVLALACDLLEGEKKQQAARYLVEDIERKGWHLSTGFIGTKDLMLVLSKIGRNDVAYRLIQGETFPSWGFSIRHGATSIWERWDGWTPEKGFQTPNMNSFAHYSFGAVYQWMVENIGGIQSDGPAYKRIRLAPQPGGTLTWARTSYRSVRGPIETSWRTEVDGAWLLDVSIPPGTSATLVLPARDRTAVTEGGKPLERVKLLERVRDRYTIQRVEGVQILRGTEESLYLEISSGRYSFHVSPEGS